MILFFYLLGSILAVIYSLHVSNVDHLDLHEDIILFIMIALLSFFGILIVGATKYINTGKLI